MPHFVVDISENILEIQPAQTLIATIHNTAEASDLFAKGNIKVRLNPFAHFTCGGTQSDFIHIFAHIMGGRNADQKKALSDAIMVALKPLYPEVPVLSINVYDFDPATYSNRDRVD